MNEYIINEFKNLASNQFANHKYSNIFYNDILHFAEDGKPQLSLIRKSIDTLTQEQIYFICDFCKKEFIKTFYNTNQYLYFSKIDEEDIFKIYVDLILALKNTNLALETIERDHYDRIKHFIMNTNPSVYQMNNNDLIEAKQYVCAQYSSAFLLKLFKVNLNEIIEPILDIGCGPDGYLVIDLQSRGLCAMGFDRNAEANHIQENDWLTYDYGLNKWGTIISNLSFTSHFLYHHLQNEDISNQYASTFMDILSSLKVNGKWIYAPSILFFEELLPLDKFIIIREKVHEDFFKTTITKIAKD